MTMRNTLWAKAFLTISIMAGFLASFPLLQAYTPESDTLKTTQMDLALFQGQQAVVSAAVQLTPTAEGRVTIPHLPQWLSPEQFTLYWVNPKTSPMYSQQRLAPQKEMKPTPKPTYTLEGYLDTWLNQSVTLRGMGYQSGTQQGKLLQWIHGHDMALVETSEGIRPVEIDHLLLNGKGPGWLPQKPETPITLEEQTPGILWRLATADKKPWMTPLPALLQYELNGLSWHSSYEVILQPDAKHAMLSGFMHLNNNTQAQYTQANVRLIAGQMNRQSPHYAQRVYAAKAMMNDAYEAGAAPGSPSRQSLGDLHEYSLGVLNIQPYAQVKQALFQPVVLPVTKQFLADTYTQNGEDDTLGNRHTVRVQWTLDTQALASQGFKEPLPQGTLRMLMPHPQQSDMLQMIGEVSINDTPSGKTVSYSTHEAFDLVVYRKVTAQETTNNRTWQDITLTLHNSSAKDATVYFDEHGYGKWQLESQPTTSATPSQALPAMVHLNAQTKRLTLQVPANGKVTWRYRHLQRG